MPRRKIDALIVNSGKSIELLMTMMIARGLDV